jgi:glycosyltransferase involved in cell wall biosynthesis
VVVDVGIPTLGDSPYILEAVESVFAQTLTSWRLVISENGGGSAAVREALDPYLRDPRVHHRVIGERVGRGENHTRLVRAGHAPYVGILHDDDRWSPEFLERHVRFLELHPTCGFVFSGHTVIDAEGRQRGRKKLVLEEGIHPTATVLPPLYRRNFIGVPTVLVRRTAYEAVGARYKEVISCDHEMWLRLAARFDVGCIAAWDAAYRIHPAQTSSRRNRLAQEEFEIFHAVEDLPIPRYVRRRVHSEAHVRCALDAAERAERETSLHHLALAMRTDPRSALRPSIVGRSLATLATLATGSPGRRTLTAVRARRWEKGGADGFLDAERPATQGADRATGLTRST